ncbi:MAG TPA: sugar phosphate isomerase/epimerase family protein [Acidimicrobiales bacterium]|nr:sugar phosphate isomerase/epimerase family protein [Acidimicrobiales bacterium]
MPAILLSTAAVFPHTELGFQLAAEAGYDGVELMVNHDRRSQGIDAVKELVASYAMPVRSVHVPCLVVTQHVWGFGPEMKLRRSVEMAEAVGADVVVVHPPFRWQRDYRERFVEVVAELQAAAGPTVAVENMYRVMAWGREVKPYLFNGAERLAGFDQLTLDTSHIGADRAELLEFYDATRGHIAHLHLSDSTMTKGDEHMLPGAGVLPLSDLAAEMVNDGFDGHVVLEIAIGRLPEDQRNAGAADALAWTAEAFGVSGPG